MPTILHISDLHRTAKPRIRNDDLLAAIISDASRWESEGIPWPDLIVVSGDVIQGAPADAEDPDFVIDAQYAEAADFLGKLGTAFVGSNRSRILIVPGNHDVNWSRARSSMSPLVEPCPEDIGRVSLRYDSDLRWNWKEQRAYQITDRSAYQSRFDHFKRFRSEFYHGVTPDPLSHNHKDLVVFEDSSLGLIVVGFSSWHGNDCFNPVGEIAPDAITYSREVIAQSTAPIAVAVWHHSIVGGPRAQDYMDSRTIHRLVDFGFTIGIHGHQHYPGAAPFELRLPNLSSMVVVAGGSIAVGDSELPMGEPRQFNVVVIDPVSESIKVHVRAMSHAGIFTGSYRNDFGGRTFMTLDLPIAESRVDRQPTITQRIDDALTAVSLGQYEQALELIADIDPVQHGAVRYASIKAVEGLGRRQELIELLQPPQNVDEAVKLIALLLEHGRYDEAGTTLESTRELVGQLYDDLLHTIAATQKVTS